MFQYRLFFNMRDVGDITLGVSPAAKELTTERTAGIQEQKDRNWLSGT